MSWNKAIGAVSILAALLVSPFGYAQEEVHAAEMLEEHDFLHHQLGIVLGHAHISNGVKDGETNWQVLPSFGINYNYWFNEEWSIGLHTDIIVETYEVERHLDGESTEVIERETPVAPALMVGYKPHEHFGFLLGPGFELAPEEDLFLIRVETEYSIEMVEKLEFEAGIGYDFRIDAFDSWSLVLGIARSF